MHWRLTCAAIVGLTLLGGREAFAGATVDLLFTEKNGAPITATNTVSASSGDTLTMAVLMSNDQPLTIAVFSLNYDLDGDNELDVDSAEQWEGISIRTSPPPECFFEPVGPLAPTTATFVGSFQGVTTCFAAPVTLPTGSQRQMGTVTWKVNSGVNTDGADILSGVFNTGVDGFADNMFNLIDASVLFRSATVNGPGAPVCGNGDVEAGEGCDDGDTMSGDGCSSSCAVETGFSCTGEPSVCTPLPVCGNSMVEGTEQCDLGSALNGQPSVCCTGTCTFKAVNTICRGSAGACDVAEVCSGTSASCPSDGFASPGTACPNGDLCDGNETCDGAGNCDPGTPLNCDDNNLCTQDSCVPQSGCVNAGTPAATCEVSTSGTLLVDERLAGNERVMARIFKDGLGLGQTDFGNPLNAGGTAYSLCIYGGGTLVGQLDVDRAAATCGNRPCWKTVGGSPPDGSAFGYLDRARGADGVERLYVSGDPPNGQPPAQIRVSAFNNAGRGQLALPIGIAASLAGESEATIQLMSSDAECISATIPRIDAGLISTYFRGRTD